LGQRILVTGSAGFIGRYLYRYLADQGFDLVGLDKLRGSEVDIVSDLSDGHQLTRVLCSTTPDVIIHCGAIKDLEECQKERMLAWNTNVGSTHWIVQYLLGKPGKKVIYISSDIVFDGKKGNYTEHAPPNPVNWYGTTKFHGELLLRQLDNYAICRTALVLGDLTEQYRQLLKHELAQPILGNQTLLPHYVYNRLIRGNPVAFPDDVVSSPTHLELVGLAIARILQLDLRGIFHVSGAEQISRYGFAARVAEYHRLSRDLVRVDNTRISPIRPKNVGLNTESTFARLGIAAKDWNVDGILRLLVWEELL